MVHLEQAVIEVSIRSPRRNAGRLMLSQCIFWSRTVSIRSPRRNAGRRRNVVHPQHLHVFNPLPASQCGETTRRAEIGRAHV